MGLQEEIQDIILARLIRELQPEEEKKFQLWLNENPKHRKEYEELSSIRRVVRWGERRELVNREEGWKQLVKKYQRRRNIRKDQSHSGRQTENRRRERYRSFIITAHEQHTILS